MGNEQGSTGNNYTTPIPNTQSSHPYSSDHIASMSNQQFDEILDEVNNEIAHHYDSYNDTLQFTPINSPNPESKIDQDNMNNTNINDIDPSPSITSFISSPENIVSNINTIFEYISELGKGASCRVFKARHLENNKLYAIKELTKSDEINETLFEKEVHLLRKLLHPNILHYHDCYMDDNNYYIATEYCSGKIVSVIIYSHKLYNHYVKMHSI